MAEADLESKTTSPYSLSLIITALVIFLAALDQTVIITVLPSVVESFGLTVDEAFGTGIWVVTGYLLGYTAAMPLLGRIADAFGHRRIFLISMAIFAVGSVGCALAGSMEALIGWRILQAIGGGAVLPIGLAIAMQEVAPDQRATALGLLGAAGEAGGVLGPAYGGLISRIELGGIDGWRWVFWLNIPLLALMAWGVLRWLPQHLGRRGRRVRVDYMGGGLLALSLSTLTIALSRSLGSMAVDPALVAQNIDQFATDWSDPQTITMLVVSVVAFIGFIIRQLRTTVPLIDLRTFRIPAFSSANFTNVLVGMALIVGMVNVPFFAATVLLRDSLGSGLLLIRLTIMIPIGAVIGGLLMRYLSARIVAALGMLLTAAGFALLGTLTPEHGELRTTFDLLLTGSGFGLIIPALSAAAIGAVDRNSMGMAAGLLNTLRMVGITLGIAALASWSLTERVGLLAKIDYLAAPEVIAANIRNAEMQVYHTTFFAAAVICLLALIPIWWLPKERSEIEAPLMA